MKNKKIKTNKNIICIGSCFLFMLMLLVIGFTSKGTYSVPSDPFCLFHSPSVSKTVSLNETASLPNGVSYNYSDASDWTYSTSGDTSLFSYGGGIAVFNGSSTPGTYNYTVTYSYQGSRDSSEGCEASFTVEVVGCSANQYVDKNGKCQNCVSGSTSTGGTSTSCTCTDTSKHWIPNVCGNCNNTTAFDSQVNCADAGDDECGTGHWTGCSSSNSNGCYTYSCEAKYTCKAGEYLPANKTSCEECPSGSYCTGGTFYKNSSSQGIVACNKLASGAYTNSAAGAKAASECYIPASELNGKYVKAVYGAPVACATSNYCPGFDNVYYGQTGGIFANTTEYCHYKGYYGTEAEAKAGTTITYGVTSKCEATKVQEGVTYKLVEEEIVNPSGSSGTSNYSMCYQKECKYRPSTVSCNNTNKQYYTSNQAADAGHAACPIVNQNDVTGLKSTPYDTDTQCYTYECRTTSDSSEYTVTFKNSTTVKCTPSSTNGTQPKCTVTAPTTATCSNGLSFVGWDTSSSSTTVAYAGGSTITVRASQTFYPVCKVGGLDSACKYVGYDDGNIMTVTIKKQYLGCRYTNIMWDGQPATAVEKQACCNKIGWRYAPDDAQKQPGYGLSYEYCIICGSKDPDPSSNPSASSPSNSIPKSSSNSTNRPANSSHIYVNPPTSNILLYVLLIVGIGFLGFVLFWHSKNIKED